MRNDYRCLTLILPLALGACGGDDQPGPGYPPQGTYANLQIVNDSWDAPPIDVLLDGQPFVTQVDYGQGTGELPITPGAHSVVVQIETPGAATTVIGPTTLDASANMDYVVAVQAMSRRSPPSPCRTRSRSCPPSPCGFRC